ncbi:MAG: nitrous oxide reductase family maturation protein NosD, partial [Chloroflexota bacterium]
IATVVALRGERSSDEVTARRRSGDRVSPELTCGDTPRRNKCKRSRDCCSGLCDKPSKRCTYRESGEPCARNAECLPPLQCVSGFCAAPPVATPTPVPTATATATPAATATPDACLAPGVDVLQAAIDAATSGDVICLRAGTFTASSGNYLAVITKNLTIIGASEATTILDGGSQQSGIRIGSTDYSSAITVSISDLSIQNGMSYHGASGIYVFGRSGMTVTLTDVTVKDGTHGSGIWLDEGPNGQLTATFTRVTATNNDGRPNAGRGGGIHAYGNLTMVNCDITNNHVKAEGGGLCLAAGATVTMTGGSISGNTAHEYTPGNYGNGAGFMLFNGASSFTATNVTMSNNVAEGIGGLGYVAAGESTLSLNSCTISGNTAVASCACVYQRWNTNCNSSYCV